jgi:nicotinamidase/pyrazinamidase
LESFLILHQVGNLYLVGLDAAYCVHKTALGALNRGYKVTVVKDAILARDDMNDILKRYEKDGIAVTTSKELVEE